MLLLATSIVNYIEKFKRLICLTIHRFCECLRYFRRNQISTLGLLGIKPTTEVLKTVTLALDHLTLAITAISPIAYQNTA